MIRQHQPKRHNPKSRSNRPGDSEGMIVPRQIQRGNVQRAPELTPLLQMARLNAPSRIFTRVFKYRNIFTTEGGQTFVLSNWYIYNPFAMTRVVTGSITVFAGLSATAVDIFACFQFYRVREIMIGYTSVASTSLALPPIYCAMQPNISPFNLGTAANTSITNSVQNSVQIDPHFSTSLIYKIPRPSDIQATFAGNELDGGWLPSAYAQTAPLSTSDGVITVCTGDSQLAAPLTTVFGALDVEYLIDFKLPE